MQKPLLSIVSSIYNGGDNLKEFLQCISNQTYENIEVVLVDDCSTDKKTKEIINDLETGRIEFKKPLKLIKNIKNLGLFKSFQKGLDNATGEYFAFPESDDFLDLDFYEIMMDEIIRYNGIDAVKGLMINNYSAEDLLYGNDEYMKEHSNEQEIISVIEKVALPIPVKNSTGQIISYIMPDITYSWFYVFSKALLLEGSTKPIFKNAIQYGFSNSVFTSKYKEKQISLDKASFYYYNAHTIFEDGGCILTKPSKKNKQVIKLKADANLLKDFLIQYDKAIETIEKTI